MAASRSFQNKLGREILGVNERGRGHVAHEGVNKEREKGIRVLGAESKMYSLNRLIVD